MTQFLRVLGTGLFVGGTAAVIVLSSTQLQLRGIADRPFGDQADMSVVTFTSGDEEAPEPRSEPVATAAPEARGAIESEAARDTSGSLDSPITYLEVPSIGLASEVVPSMLVPTVGGFTWLVPSFRVGHAEATASAGERGNAVLLGHVTSRNLGNVFQQLHRARVGDQVLISGGDARFTYRVVESKVVPRTDISVIQPTEEATVSLITCTGQWLPQLNDYAERLVVRAELTESR